MSNLKTKPKTIEELTEEFTTKLTALGEQKNPLKASLAIVDLYQHLRTIYQAGFEAGKTQTIQQSN